ncbi:uncharacterized protein PG998_008152 [Apiospora kogelbergensis]|uniref:Secreted protein n=1 Tax=Apiospora kogelbergensis TaxID=1337665 RepID=A0AAW0QFF8_9PEZI
MLLAGAEIVYACCVDGCYCVKADSHRVADCSDGPLGGQTAFANYGKASDCTSLANTQSVKGYNYGCGSSSLDVHWYRDLVSCQNDPYGGGGDWPYSKQVERNCVTKPDGSAYMRSICN